MAKDSRNQDIFAAGRHILIAFSDSNGQIITSRAHIRLDDTAKIILQPEGKIIQELLKPDLKKVTLMYMNDKDTYKYIANTVVIEVRANPPLITVAKPQGIETGLRRRHFRCKVLLEFKYTHNQKTWRGNVTNLSESGLWAVIPENPELSAANEITCELKLPNHGIPLLLTGRIIRIHKLSHPHTQGFAVEFQELPAMTRRILVKYIFQRQREIIQLER